MSDDNKLTRHEAHDLNMLLAKRTKVLIAEAEAQAERINAKLENQLATYYRFDQEKVWMEAKAAVDAAIDEANQKVQARCHELGIPSWARPEIGGGHWFSRGENALAARRQELRAAGQAKIKAMFKTAVARIERQEIELRTEVLSKGVLSAVGQQFLETLKPIGEAMDAVDVAALEHELEHRQENAPPRRLTDLRMRYEPDDDDDSSPWRR
jgi:hypothetical protein